MAWSGFRSASSRRSVLAIGMALLIGATSSASVKGAPQDQQQQDGLKLNIDGPALILFFVKKDRVADFESMWPALRSTITKSSKEGVKEFADTLYPYKVEGMDVPLYMLKLDKVSKQFSYNPVTLLFYLDKEAIKYDDAMVVHKKWEGATDRITVWPLTKMGG